MAPGPASRTAAPDPKKKPVPIAPPRAIMLTWRGLRRRAKTSSRAATVCRAGGSDEERGKDEFPNTLSWYWHTARRSTAPVRGAVNEASTRYPGRSDRQSTMAARPQTINRPQYSAGSRLGFVAAFTSPYGGELTSHYGAASLPRQLAA